MSMESPPAAAVRRSKVSIPLVVAIAAVLVLAAAAWFTLGWIHGSTTIEYGNSTGPGAATAEYTSVDPATGSNGRRVFFVSMEKPGYFVALMPLRNTSRWPIRIDGFPEVEYGYGGKWPMYLTERTPPDEPVKRLDSVTLQPGEYRDLGLQLVIPENATCGPNDVDQGRTWSELVNLKTHYLNVFDETKHVETPFAIVLVCGKLPTAWSDF